MFNVEFRIVAVKFYTIYVSHTIEYCEAEYKKFRLKLGKCHFNKFYENSVAG